MIGAHTKLVFDAGFIEHIAIHGVHTHDVWRHQLRHVFVASRDDHFAALRFSLHCQRADDIVGFHAADAQHGPAHLRHQILDLRGLAAQFVGHRRARCLVIGIHLIAKRRAFGIEHACGVIVRKVYWQAFEHIEHAKQSACGFAAGRRQGRHRMECAVEVRRAVDQKQGFHGVVYLNGQAWIVA